MSLISTTDFQTGAIFLVCHPTRPIASGGGVRLQGIPLESSLIGQQGQYSTDKHRNHGLFELL